MTNTEFFKKDAKTICNFLCRDELKVGTEVEVLRIILAWISNNGEGRYDVIDQLMRCVRFRDMSQKQLIECDNRVKAMGDIVLLYAYRSIVPRLMAEQLQDDVNVSSTGPRTCKTGQFSDLESLLNILTSQEDVSSDVSEFEDDSDIDEEAQVQSKEKDLLQESMEILQEKMDILNARVWDNPGDISIEEFKKLPLRNADTSMDVAKESENIDKNRYKNILPYDYNRVKVTDCCNGSDYINASYMKMEMNGRKEAMTNYIATQGPLPQTSRCFWTMVWQEKAQRILMLTSEKESKIIKCYKYWPYYQCSSIHGDIHVTCTKEEGSASHLITRKFKLKNLKTKEERTVTQQQYVGWPGLGGPNDTDDFVDLLSTIRRETKGSKKPTIVHCSAGVGRSGVFITLDTAWSLMEAKQPVYPLEIIKELREQRTNCVQTVRQYEFICNAILKIYHEKFGTRKAQPEKRLSPWRRMFNRLRKTVCGCFGGQQEHQREWCSDGPLEARNQPDWRTPKDEHPSKRARVCQQDDYFTPMEPTQLEIKRPPSPALSCPGVTSVTSQKDLTPGQRKYPKFKVKKRTCVEKMVEKKPIRTGQQHSADQYAEIKALLTGWPLIDLFPEPIRCEDFDFRRCLYECLHQRDIHRWPAHKDQLVYGPVLNGSNVR